MNKTNETCFSFKKQINFDGTEDLFITNVLSCVLNLSFSLLTSLGNFLIIYAIGKTQDLHSAPFILLGCLAASDLLVGLICQPLFVALKNSRNQAQESHCVLYIENDCNNVFLADIWSFFIYFSCCFCRSIALPASPFTIQHSNNCTSCF